jgi:hypothetical protein
MRAKHVCCAAAMSMLAGCAGPVAPVDLGQIVAKNRHAISRPTAAAETRTMEVDLKMEERGTTLDAVYKVTRDGRMRIDILKDGKRIYTEAYDGRQGWDCSEDGSKATIDPHGDALWHGTQFPGTIFALSDMAALGHRLDYVGREQIDGVNYYVLRLTLRDGFETYRYVNPETWLIDRGRDFRAFHPAVNDKKTWVETLWSDYRDVGGVLRPFVSTNVDLVAARQLAKQEITAYRVNPTLDPAIFSMPGVR